MSSSHRRPPRFLRAGSMGAGSGLTVLTGGGSSHFSIFCSISASSESPTVPSDDSWKLSTRAARVHLAATRRDVFRLMSYGEDSAHEDLVSITFLLINCIIVQKRKSADTCTQCTTHIPQRLAICASYL